MLLNNDIVDIEKFDGICSTVYFENEFQKIFYIHQSVLSNIQDLHNSKWCFIKFLMMIKF